MVGGWGGGAGPAGEAHGFLQLLEGALLLHLLLLQLLNQLQLHTALSKQTILDKSDPQPRLKGTICMCMN